MSRCVLAAASLAAGALLFAGCASTPGASGSSPSVEEPSASAVDLEVAAGWLDGGRFISLVTWGSSSCVPVADEATLGADGSVAVTLSTPGEVCTADYAPRATLVAPPEGVDPAEGLDLVVTLDDARGEVSLDPFSGDAVAEYTPAAGWIDDGMFALLTWGSSSCAPVVESTSVDSSVSPVEVSVVFADPGMKACTRDMAPRIALVSVDGAARDGAVAVLTGGGAEFADPVTVPIA